MVDDDPFVRDALARIVTSLGFDAIQAEDGEKGAEAFRQQSGRLALTLLDAVMPGPSAEETLDRLLAHDPSARVVLMSGWSQDDLGERVRAGAYSGVTFLRKPFLIGQIQSFLEGFRPNPVSDAKDPDDAPGAKSPL